MKRALLWAFRCRFGRRCLDVELLDWRVPGRPGAVVEVAYTCPVCGTEYWTGALAGRDGTFVSGGRVRAKGDM